MNKFAKDTTLAAATQGDPRWSTVLAHDARGDGRFFYSVRTTGVYCRPSCAARTPRPENVAFHASSAAAERAGFRPCKRCKPDLLVASSRRTPIDGDGIGEIRFATGRCSLGVILAAHSGRGLCAILLGDEPQALVRDLQERFPRSHLVDGDDRHASLLQQVIDLIEHPGRRFDVPLDAHGTAFQQRVWQVLRTIPPGSTASYAEVARRMDAPRAVRAVAQACAANPLAVAIPCHRVLRSDGGLSGYRWGVARKRALLQREVRT